MRIGLILALVISGYAVALPPSTDGSLEKLKLVKYEHKQCYQDLNGVNAGLYSISVLQGIDRIQPGHRKSNTHEFPWMNTAGHTGKANHYVHLPPDRFIEYTDRSGRWPEHGDYERVIQWTYPEGTVFAEELLLPDGKVFEVRVREKLRGKWYNRRYLPYANAEDLIEKVEKSGALAYAELLRKPELKPFRLSEPRANINFSGYRENLPEMSEKLRSAILNGKFVPNAEWREDCHTPSATDDNNIVPKDYTGFAFPAGSKACMTCHEQTTAHAFALESGRDWYGRLRGSDGIFSFHIFDEESIEETYPPSGKKLKLNPKLPLRKKQ